MIFEDARDLAIRPATAADLAAINDIYNHYVLHSTCTYQLEPETDGGPPTRGSTAAGRFILSSSRTFKATLSVGARFRRCALRPAIAIRLKTPCTCGTIATSAVSAAIC